MPVYYCSQFERKHSARNTNKNTNDIHVESTTSTVALAICCRTVDVGEREVEETLRWGIAGDCRSISITVIGGVDVVGIIYHRIACIGTSAYRYVTTLDGRRLYVCYVGIWIKIGVCILIWCNLILNAQHYIEYLNVLRCDDIHLDLIDELIWNKYNQCKITLLHIFINWLERGSPENLNKFTVGCS